MKVQEISFFLIPFSFPLKHQAVEIPWFPSTLYLFLNLNPASNSWRTLFSFIFFFFLSSFLCLIPLTPWNSLIPFILLPYSFLLLPEQSSWRTLFSGIKWDVGKWMGWGDGRWRTLFLCYIVRTRKSKNGLRVKILK